MLFAGVAPAAPARVFRTALLGPIDSFDPARADTNAAIYLVSNLTEPLLRRNSRTGDLDAAAAESFSVSEDGLKLTFTLRKDLYWSNGEKVTAEDFVFTFRRLLSPSTDPWIADRFTSIKGATEFREGAMIEFSQLGISSSGDRTLIIELAHPDPFLLETFAHPCTGPAYRKIVDAYPSNWWLPERWVGSGPFLPSAREGEAMILRKNPHHRFAGKILLDEVRISLLSSAEDGVRQYLDGRLDQFGYKDAPIPDSQLIALSGRPDLVFQPDLKTNVIRLNTRRLPLSQSPLREALAMVLDRDLLATTMTLGSEASAFSLMPPKIKGYDPPRGYLLNRPGALRVLEDHGYCTRGAKGTCKPLPGLTFVRREGVGTLKVALALQAIWKKQLGWGDFRMKSLRRDEFKKAIESGDFEVALDEVSAEAENPFALLEAFRTGRKTAGGFSSRAFDQLLDQARTEPAMESAMADYRRAEAHLLREGGVIPLFYGTTAMLVSPKVRGVLPNIWDIHLFSDIQILP